MSVVVLGCSTHDSVVQYGQEKNTEVQGKKTLSGVNKDRKTVYQGIPPRSLHQTRDLPYSVGKPHGAADAWAAVL